MDDVAVAAINGLLGDRKGLDVTDMVNPRALKAGRDFYLSWCNWPARGGAGPIAKRHFYRWCLSKVESDKRILLVGKSYGAHWCLDAIEDLHIGYLVDALVFDPTSVLRRRETHTRTMACPANITVVRQLGHRSGYRVAGANDKIIDATHSNIERTKAGRSILDTWLTKHGL
jgi:hypothetical protein